MKELLVIAFEFPPIRASNDRTYHFCRYLPEFGWQPIVIAPRKPTYYTYYDNSLPLPPGLEVHDASAMQSKLIFRTFKLTKIFPYADLFWISSYQRGKELLRNRHHEIKCIYATSPSPSATISAYLLSQEFSKPLALDFRDPYQRHPLYHWLYRKILLSAQIIITTSEVYKRDLMGFGAPQEKIVIIPNGTDLAFINNLRQGQPPRSQEFTIAYAGIIDPLYRVKTLLETACKVSQEKVRVKIIGSLHCDRDNLQDFVIKNGLKNVEFKGRLSQEQTIKELLNATIAYNGSSHPGGIGGKIYDYMACGLPVLGYNSNDSATYSFIKEHGIGLAADTPEGLQENLRTLLDNPALIQEIRQRELNTIGQFDRRALTQKLSGVLDNINS